MSPHISCKAVKSEKMFDGKLAKLFKPRYLYKRGCTRCDLASLGTYISNSVTGSGSRQLGSSVRDRKLQSTAAKVDGCCAGGLTT
jgi:hypothetical protein